MVMSEISPKEFNMNHRGLMQSDMQPVLAFKHANSGLASAFDWLHQQQSGWDIVSSNPEFDRLALANIENSSQWLIATANKNRGRRAQGFGKSDAILVRGGCKLCLENIQARSVRQLAYEFALVNRPVIALVNPYPNGKEHFTIATREHMAHHFSSANDISEIVTSVAALSRQLPERMVFWHGAGAGMTVDHRHYQVLSRHDDNADWPLERAAESVLNSGKLQEVGYVIPVWAIRDSADAAISQITTMLVDHSAKSQHLSANIAATSRMSDSSVIDLYCCLRDSRRVTPRLAGVVGSLEILGEIVLSSDDELSRFKSGQIGYNDLARILSDVRP